MKFDKISVSPFPVVRIFLIIYLVLNLVGIINFPLHKDKLDPSNILLVFFLGLAGFVIGVVLLRPLKINLKKTKPDLNKTKYIKILFLFFNVTTFVSIIYTNLKTGGIIIFSKFDRFQIFAIAFLFLYMTIAITLVYYANRLMQNKKIRWYDLVFIAFQCALFLTLGLRSPLVMLLAGLFIVFYSIRNDYQNKLKQVFNWKVIVGALVFLAIMSSVASFRVSRKYDVKRYFRNINHEIVEENPYLAPFVPTIALFRYNQWVVNKIIEETSGDPMYMGLALANFSTVLPGQQWGSRNHIGYIIGGRENERGVPWSITPTLQGAFFVDGGYILVFVGFFVTAVVAEIIRKIIIKKRDPFLFAMYALFATSLLKSIHTGYEDVNFFIILSGVFILRFFVYKIDYRIPKGLYKKD
jgi:oligosaccharide repeat unit polymerase